MSSLLIRTLQFTNSTHVRQNCTDKAAQRNKFSKWVSYVITIKSEVITALHAAHLFQCSNHYFLTQSHKTPQHLSTILTFWWRRNKTCCQLLHEWQTRRNLLPAKLRLENASILRHRTESTDTVCGSAATVHTVTCSWLQCASRGRLHAMRTHVQDGMERRWRQSINAAPDVETTNPIDPKYQRRQVRPTRVKRLRAHPAPRTGFFRLGRYL